MHSLELGMLLSEQVDDTCFDSTSSADLCHRLLGGLFSSFLATTKYLHVFVKTRKVSKKILFLSHSLKGSVNIFSNLS